MVGCPDGGVRLYEVLQLNCPCRCGGLGGPKLHNPACNIPHCPPPNNSLFTNTW
eukprot:jgi/Botrbrau1/22719/Bobra.0132s0058.1